MFIILLAKRHEKLLPLQRQCKLVRLSNLRKALEKGTLKIYLLLLLLILLLLLLLLLLLDNYRIQQSNVEILGENTSFPKHIAINSF